MKFKLDEFTTYTYNIQRKSKSNRKRIIKQSHFVVASGAVIWENGVIVD